LTLRSITLPDLALLLPMCDLLSLDLKLGGTKNLDLLPEVGQLRYLELWMVRGLSDLSAIAQVQTLQFLFLQALKQVTELPSLAALSELRRVHLETMKGLNDLSPVAHAPQLLELEAVDMRHLRPEAFAPFVGHPTLRFSTIGLGSLRKNEAVSALLGLPRVAAAFDFR
jgi:hypothetical protein